MTVESIGLRLCFVPRLLKEHLDPQQTIGSSSNNYGLVEVEAH